MDFEAAIVALRNHSEIVWLLPFLATAASLMVAGMVFWIGRRIGINGLEHWISPALLSSVKHEVGRQGAIALVLPALLPPPFPLMPFVLASGALSVSASRFFVMFAGLRLIRFSALTALAWFYGQQILNMFQSGTLNTVIAVLVVLIAAGTLTTIYRLSMRVRRRHLTSLEKQTIENAVPVTAGRESTLPLPPEVTKGSGDLYGHTILCHTRRQ